MTHSWKIGIIGDFNPKNRSHLATNEALVHASVQAGVVIDAQWIPTVSLETETAPSLRPFHALWCSPGSPYQSMAGALHAIRFAREQNIPFLGT